jgi:hypothetical protein
MSEGSTVDNWGVVGTGVAVLAGELDVHPATNTAMIKSNTPVKIILFFIMSFKILLLGLILLFYPEPPHVLSCQGEKPNQRVFERMDLLSFCGKFATGISVAIVLGFIALIALAVFCFGLGALSNL